MKEKKKRAREGAGKFRRPFPRASANWRQTTNRRREMQKENEAEGKKKHEINAEIGGRGKKLRRYAKPKPAHDDQTRREYAENDRFYKTGKLGCRSRSFFLSLAFTCDLGLECSGTANTQTLIQYAGTHVLYTNTPTRRPTLETCTHWTHGPIATRFPKIAAHSQDRRRLATR